jgi:hypothetical protein
VERVFTWSELQPKRLIERDTEDAQRHVESAEDDCRPGGSNLVAVPRQDADDQQCDAPHHVEHVVADVGGIHRHAQAAHIDQQQPRTVEQQTDAQDPQIDLHQPHRVHQSELGAQQAHT